MARNVEEHIIRLKDEMSKKLGKIENNIASLNKSMQNVNKSTEKVSSTMSAIKWTAVAAGAMKVAQGMVQIGKASIDTSRQFENMQNKMNFALDSKDFGASSFERVSALSQKLGINIQSAVTGFTDLQAASIGTAFTSSEVTRIFESVSKAATVLHLDAQKTQSVFLALEQMMSKGTVSMEELRRQLGNALPGALSIAARSMGKTQMEFNKMVENGEILAQDLLPRLATELDKTFAPGLDAAINSSQAHLERYRNEVILLRKELGDMLLPTFNEVISAMTRFMKGTREGTLNLSRAVNDPTSGLSAFDSAFEGVIDTLKDKKLAKTLEEFKDRLNKPLAEAAKGGEITEKELSKIREETLSRVNKSLENVNKSINVLESRRKSAREAVEKAERAGGSGSFKEGTRSNQELIQAKSLLESVSKQVVDLVGEREGLTKFKAGIDSLLDKGANAALIAAGNSAGDGKGGKLKSGIASIRATTPKNITINIGSLIKENNNNFKQGQERSDAKSMEKVLTEALIRVVNDATTVNEK